MDTRTLSIVVPVCNEQDSLHALMDEIARTAGELACPVEVVFVDDGSSDDSWPRIMALAQKDPRVGGVRFRGNAGKAAALMAGFSAVRGEVVITMDADLQDPPQEIPHLIAKLDQGYDVVSGWKLKRYDPWHKVYPSRIFNRLVSLLTGVRLHDHVCGLKCYRRHVLADLRIHGDQHRFLAVFAAAGGHRVTEIPTLHRPRTTGRGKYGFSRYAKGLLDLGAVLLMTRFRWRPQHLIGVAGLWIVVAGTLLLLVQSGLSACAAYALRPEVIFEQRTISSGVMFLVNSAQMLLTMGELLVVPLFGLALVAIGWAAELTVAQQPQDRLYDIVERTGWCAHRVPVVNS